MTINKLFSGNVQGLDASQSGMDAWTASSYPLRSSWLSEWLNASRTAVQMQAGTALPARLASELRAVQQHIPAWASASQPFTPEAPLSPSRGQAFMPALLRQTMGLSRTPAVSNHSTPVVERPEVSLHPLRPAAGADDHQHLHGPSDVEGDSCQLREAILVDGSNQTSSVALMNLAWTFQLHSSPTSSKVIYLDFDGHTTSGTSWNNSTMGSSFYSPAYDFDGNPASFSNDELSRIQQIWQRVAADYAPFDVDVTTQAPPTDWLIKNGSIDANYGIRALITSYGPSSSTAGGIAVVNSFNAASDTPCFIYNKTLTGVAEAISHEVGHTLGLSHDGTSSSAYYYGHGGGETSWAPIMGVGYNKNVTQWDNGT